MAKKTTATVTFKLKDGTVKTFQNHPITIQADGSVGFLLKLGRIVPGTDVAIVIDGTTFNGKATTRPGGGDNIDVTLPAGTVTGAAVS